MFITADALRAQVAYFHERGYSGLTFGECERRRADKSLPEKVVVFTFDDAFESVQHAATILDEVGWVGTIFVVTDFAGEDNRLSWFGLDPGGVGLNWNALREMSSRGWEIGSHTCSHPLLTSLPDLDLEKELRDSRSRIESEVGNCRVLAYPYGIGDSRTAEAVQGCGYTAACTLTGAHTTDTPYLRPRLRLESRDVNARLMVKTSRVSLAARRSFAARLVRRLPRDRSWLPAGH